MKNSNIFGFHPNGFNIPRNIVIGYLVIFGIPAIILALLGQKVPSMLFLCLGMCAFVLTDVLMEQRKSQSARLFRRIHGIVTCCFSGAVFALCIIMLFSGLS